MQIQNQKPISTGNKPDVGASNAVSAPATPIRPRLEDDSLLTTVAAAAYIGVRPHTLSVWRTTGRYNLPWIKSGWLVRYRKSDLDAFLDSRTFSAK